MLMSPAVSKSIAPPLGELALPGLRHLASPCLRGTECGSGNALCGLMVPPVDGLSDLPADAACFLSN